MTAAEPRLAVLRAWRLALTILLVGSIGVFVIDVLTGADPVAATVSAACFAAVIIYQTRVIRTRTAAELIERGPDEEKNTNA